MPGWKFLLSHLQTVQAWPQVALGIFWHSLALLPINFTLPTHWKMTSSFQIENIPTVVAFFEIYTDTASVTPVPVLTLSEHLEFQLILSKKEKHVLKQPPQVLYLRSWMNFRRFLCKTWWNMRKNSKAFIRFLKI